MNCLCWLYDDCKVSVHALYENNGEGLFTHFVEASFIGLLNCDVMWGDYDVDGITSISLMVTRPTLGARLDGQSPDQLKRITSTVGQDAPGTSRPGRSSMNMLYHVGVRSCFCPQRKT